MRPQGMKPSGVDWVQQIPQHWNVFPLTRCCSECRDKNTGSRESNVLSLSYGRIVRRDVETNFGLLPASFDTYKIVQDGNLVLRLTDLQNDKRSLRVGRATERGIITSAYVCLQCGPRLDDRFTYYLLHAYDIAKVFYSYGGGVRQSMKFDDFKTVPIFVPPLQTQQAIADFLDGKTAAIDALCEKKARLLALLSEKRAALIHRAVTKGLDPNVPTKDSGVPWIGEIPAHWHTRKLRYIASKLQGRLLVQPHLYFQEEGVPIVFGYNIKKGVIDESGLSRVSFDADAAHAHARASEGDLFTVRVGAPGMTAVVPPSLDGCHFASIMWVHQHPRASSEWLCHAMNSPVVQGQIHAANYGATLGQFNIADAVDWVLPFPPKREQTTIAEFLTRTLESITRIEEAATRQIEHIREYRHALITAAVTGQLDIGEDVA